MDLVLLIEKRPKQHIVYLHGISEFEPWKKRYNILLVFELFHNTSILSKQEDRVGD